MRKAGSKSAALAAVAVVLAAAGCGGSGRLSKSAYQQKLKTEAQQLKADFAGVNLAASSSNLKQLAAKLGTLQQKLEHSATNLGHLKPPKDAVDDNNKLADALHRFANLFGQIKSAAANGDAKKVQSLATQVAAIGQEGTQASADLKHKGYDIGAFGQ